MVIVRVISTLQWRHNEHHSAPNHQRPHCLPNCRFRGRSKKTSKLRFTSPCAGNSPVTGKFPTQKASNAENVCIDAVTMKMKKVYTFLVVNMNPSRVVYGAFRREDFAVLEHPIYYDVLSDQDHCCSIFTCTMHPLLILMACMFDASHGVSIKANYELGPPGVSLHCISISSRSSVECALRASVMDLYGNQFAYRDGQCHACRPDNVNCAVSEDEYLLAGPHHVRGRCMVYPNKKDK